MKKKAAIIFSAISILLGSIIIINTHWYIVDELQFRISKYHTLGNILVTVDEREINISDVPLQLFCDGNIVESTSIDNNAFSIRKGEYGLNEYRFILPLSNENLNINNIVIKIEHFNTNWWHVNDIFIYINISTETLLKASMSGSINTRDKENGTISFDFEVQEKVILQEDNTLQIRTESP